MAREIAGPDGCIICPEENLPKKFRVQPFTAEHNHHTAMRAFPLLAKALKAGRTVVVLDRPHLELWEMREAALLGLGHDYKVRIRQPSTAWARDTNECLKRTHHPLTLADLRRLGATYQRGTNVAQVLQAPTPLERKQACIRLWKELQTSPTPERKKAIDQDLFRNYQVETDWLVANHGLLAEFGWPDKARIFDGMGRVLTRQVLTA